MKNRYKFLGLAIISFSIVLISSFFILLWDSQEEDVQEDVFFSSQYISDYSNDVLTNDMVNEESMLDNDDIVLEKQGEIILDESRKVVKFDGTLDESEKEEIEEEYGVEFTNDQPVNGVYSLITTEESTLDALLEDESVDSIEVDVPVSISADTVDWGITRIGADKVWSDGSGSGVKVAIVDTGIQLDHSDLASNIIAGYDFVNNRVTAIDDNGHGTHVAGIVAATSNGSGTVGASYSAKLMPVKVLNSTGSGYISDVAKGVYWAADNGASIINMSLGASVDTDILRNAVNYAASKGVLIVAAAGNDSGAPCQYPAAYSNVICVVATDSGNRLASFSNIGGELSAPGVSNYSTYINNTFKYLSGTSMASPHVAGSLAILKNICPTCSSTELRNTLRETAIDLGESGQDIIFGYGLVDLVAAMEKLKPVEEEIPQEETEIPEEDEEGIPEEVVQEPTPTEPVKKGFDKQKPVITQPKKDNGGKYSMLIAEDLNVKFKLEPISSNSGLEKTIVYLNNEEVYTTTKQEDEYIIKYESLEGIQQFIRVTSIFEDGSQSHDQLIVDTVKLRKSTSGNIIKRGRNVLGISSGFSLKSLLGF